MEILIIDDNLKETSTLKRNILKINSKIGNIEIATNAKDGIKLIKKIKPDIILLDIIMPGIDGIGILEEINDLKLDKFPFVIIISSIENMGITKKAIELGAKYYILKPFNTEILVKRIQDFLEMEQKNYISKEILKIKENNEEYINNNDLNNKQNNKNLELVVSKILHILKFPVNIQGYKYLKEAIIIAIKDFDATSQITKGIYPDISKKFKTTPSRIERSIRHAINLTWDKNEKINYNYFNNVLNLDDKPTNSEFISILSEKLRLELINS